MIRDVDRKSLLQLAAEAAELADKARNKKLSADAMQGACFTISSLGHIGGTGFTPIVNAPEVAILGVSKATMQPVWDGKAFQPRLMLPLSLSYDHRVINGAAAAPPSAWASCWRTSAPCSCNTCAAPHGRPASRACHARLSAPPDGGAFARLTARRNCVPSYRQRMPQDPQARVRRAR